MVPFYSMKYKLETIPVWDAFDAESECPFCLLEQKAEEGYVRFFMGNSVMVPEMRVEVNKTGFCRSHYPMLFNTRANRHALGLMTHTHFSAAFTECGKELKKLAGGTKRDLKRGLAQLAEKLRRNTNACMICSRIDETLKRYLFTALYLWKKDEEGFRARYASSRGFCRRHLSGLVEMAGEVLPGKLQGEWIALTAQLTEANAERLDGELFWYTQKFDFQNDDKPWGTAKDALERGIQKLQGTILKDP